MTEEAAVHAYRMLYMRDHGPTDLPEIDGLVVVPMSRAIKGAEPPPAQVVTDIRNAEKIAKDEVLRRRASRETVREGHVKLVDDGLAYVVGKMTEGEIRASLKDIPALLKARAVLTGEAHDAQSAAGVLAVESVRVRQARANGGSVFAAMRVDLEEISVVLDALEAREEMEREAERVASEEKTGTEGPGLSLVE
jgi:hypothetical protein